MPTADRLPYNGSEHRRAVEIATVDGRAAADPDRPAAVPTSSLAGIASWFASPANVRAAGPALRAALTGASAAVPTKVHLRGTYVCMEGPQFSSRAESEMHRQWGCDLIGMTLMPEAKLAREAEICYACLALSTDYDCWRAHRTDVDQIHLLEEIIGNVHAATQNALGLIRAGLPAIASLPGSACTCQQALKLAIWSDRRQIPREVRDRLAPLTAKYLD